MINDIWTGLKHTVHEHGASLEFQHSNCPKGNNSWCKYWSDRANYHDSKWIPAVFFDELKPTFACLSAAEVVNRCLTGLTQNHNESANCILWSKCPKSKFCGRHRLVMAAAETVCHFNSGAGYVAEVCHSTRVACGANMLSTLQNIDATTIQ